MDNLIGRKIADRYNIKELIGMGGMAAVYKAECETLKRNVAVKVLLENLRGDNDTVNRNIESEAEKSVLLDAIEHLEERERLIMKMRFGLIDGKEKTQKEVADIIGISQSYISRLEKKIIKKLKVTMEKI